MSRPRRSLRALADRLVAAARLLADDTARPPGRPAPADPALVFRAFADTVEQRLRAEAPPAPKVRLAIFDERPRGRAWR